ncbi:MAG: sugar ABC transporter permease, partial [Oscillospiraceae bacterium]|nr:sugar ABC transporter permease [Oscillospiraceae bacterium]
MKVKKSVIWPYLLIAPALLVVVAVVFIPVINAIMMSFQSYDLRRPHEIGFIGLGNYLELFRSSMFWASFRRTVYWVVFGVGFQLIFGFLLALLLNRKFKGQGIARAVSLIPWVTPGVLIGLMWRWIFDGNHGVLNDMLMRLGIIDSAIPFLARMDTAFPAVIVTIIWQGIPF